MVRANELTATQSLGLMRAGLLSVEEMAQACLARIRERDSVVRGWVHLDPDLIQRNARELDKREVKGPLHGIPIAVKDVIMTADMPTEHNSPLYKGSFAAVDAGCIKTLRAAGALIFGKTDTTEFAAVTRGGTARHPLDASRTPGGSSSGSAAVVGDSQVPIGLGTQMPC
jgi:amidase